MPVLTDVMRNEKGQIMPGSQLSNRKGTFNRLTRRVKETFAKYAEEHGEEANPLIVLAQIMSDPKTETAIRVQAASKLASYLVPKKFEIESEETDTEKVAMFRRFTASIVGALPDRGGIPRLTLIEGSQEEIRAE